MASGNVEVKIKLTPAQAGKLYMKAMKLEEDNIKLVGRVTALENALDQIAVLFEEGKAEYYAVGNIISEAMDQP